VGIFNSEKLIREFRDFSEAREEGKKRGGIKYTQTKQKKKGKIKKRNPSLYKIYRRGGGLKKRGKSEESYFTSKREGERRQRKKYKNSRWTSRYK